ncbi:unnamed protein product [Closterium sp. Yama58-4]|nr:unnamed protein product [Closterium sp. Yama58-4]
MCVGSLSGSLILHALCFRDAPPPSLPRLQLCKLLMMSATQSLSVESIGHVRRELGLPEDFKTSFLPRFADRFRVATPPAAPPGTPAAAAAGGPVLVLQQWDDRLALSVAEANEAAAMAREEALDEARREAREEAREEGAAAAGGRAQGGMVRREGVGGVLGDGDRGRGRGESGEEEEERRRRREEEVEEEGDEKEEEKEKEKEKDEEEEVEAEKGKEEKEEEKEEEEGEGKEAPSDSPQQTQATQVAPITPLSPGNQLPPPKPSLTPEQLAEAAIGLGRHKAETSRMAYITGKTSAEQEERSSGGSGGSGGSSSREERYKKAVRLSLKLNLPPGLKLKQSDLLRLQRFHASPPISPYADPLELGISPESMEAERRAVAVIREFLSLTVEKRCLIDQLTHFRKDFLLPARIYALLLRHPEVFYVSVKGVRDSVFLREAYEGEVLIMSDELADAIEEMRVLMEDGRRRMRRGKKQVGVDRWGREESGSVEGAGWVPVGSVAGKEGEGDKRRAREKDRGEDGEQEGRGEGREGEEGVEENEEVRGRVAEVRGKGDEVRRERERVGVTGGKEKGKGKEAWRSKGIHRQGLIKDRW